jgi:hypothetical protein
VEDKEKFDTQAKPLEDQRPVPHKQPNRAITAAQCRQLATDHNARAKQAGISQKRTTLLTSIARSLTGLANQLEMLAADVGEKPRK